MSEEKQVSDILVIIDEADRFADNLIRRAAIGLGRDRPRYADIAACSMLAKSIRQQLGLAAKRLGKSLPLEEGENKCVTL